MRRSFFGAKDHLAHMQGLAVPRFSESPIAWIRKSILFGHEQENCDWHCASAAANYCWYKRLPDFQNDIHSYRAAKNGPPIILFGAAVGRSTICFTSRAINGSKPEGYNVTAMGNGS